MEKFYAVKKRHQCLATLAARHLGAWHHIDGLERAELMTRNAAARCGWSAMGKFWYVKETPFRVRRSVFTALCTTLICQELKPGQHCRKEINIKWSGLW